MIFKWLLSIALSKLFGDGFGADLAGRGVVYLGDGVRKALDRDEIPVTTAKLTPGATYTVVARPPVLSCAVYSLGSLRTTTGSGSIRLRRSASVQSAS